MLIKNVVLERIEAGDIDTLFRRQKRPTVKTGGTLRTRIGLLDIVRVDPVDLHEISLRDARRAGYRSVDELVADLTRKTDGDFYRVRVRVGGVDPRQVLRERAELSAAELADVLSRLDGFDERSSRGPWTRSFLTMIAEQPHVRAPDLAASIGWETKPFKEHVRKLKALGLTISHSPGYELSPRGHVVHEAR
jgi:hypothetical protein